MAYVIYEKENRKLLYGTDFNYQPPKQKTGYGCYKTWDSLEEVKREFKRRECDERYAIGELGRPEIKEVKL